MKLSIELVPRTCWFSNVRSCVSKKDWDKLRKKTYKAAGHRCEICNGKGKKWPVECHEVWHYDDQRHIQRLDRMIALCPSCHEVKHIGLAQLKGNMDRAVKHLMKVNKISLDEADEYLTKVFNQWRKRSLHSWELDLSFLDNEDVKVLDDGKR